MQSEFDLDDVIYRFNEVEEFRVRDACEGVQIFGGIGSGKSSGSGAALAKSYLRAGFGGLVLCAKKDECDTWLRYAKETNRADNIIVFDASGEWRFPFLQYEVSRDGEGAGYTENLVRLFTTVHEVMERGKGGSGGDPYWQRAMEQLLRNAIDICMMARGEVSVPLLYDLINSLPRTTEQRDSQQWRDKSLCWKLLSECRERFKHLDEWERHDVLSCINFVLEEFVHISPKTRSGIISMFTTMADVLLRRPFRMLFSEGSPQNKNAVPELTHNGQIIILNLPVKEYGEAGRVAQVIYKYMWQQAAERRNIIQNSRPVFLFCDESMYFCNDYDMQFQATARSSRACTVYLTQNLPNYYAEMGGIHSKSRVDSLVGNLQTLIFHANPDPETNNRAAEVIGRSWQTKKGISLSAGENSFTTAQSTNESYDYDVIPQEFTKLRKGSPANNYIVEAIIFQSGRIWYNGTTHLRAFFHQLKT